MHASAHLSQISDSHLIPDEILGPSIISSRARVRDVTCHLVYGGLRLSARQHDVVIPTDAINFEVQSTLSPKAVLVIVYQLLSSHDLQSWVCSEPQKAS